MLRFLNVFHSLGLIWMGFSLTLLFPYAVSIYTHDGIASHYLETAVVTFVAGLVLAGVTWPFRKELRLREGLAIVVFVWTTLGVVSAMPMWLSRAHIAANFDFAHAYYEAMSGLTTTGASAIEDVTDLPMSINLWRHTLTWFGGMGILVLAVAILPLLGVGGSQVMKGETPGPFKEEKLTPRVASTAKALYVVYMCASIACFLCYKLVGLSWFEAWCHAASTLSLGGFSTRSNSFEEINNPGADVVAMAFMLFAGINFATHFKAWQRRSLKEYLLCPEAIPFLLLLLISGSLISLYLYFDQDFMGILDAFRFGMFDTISLATTTGLTNFDYMKWPVFIPIWMLILASFSSSAGSTGGGVKLIRVRIIFKQIFAELKKLLHPHGVFPVRVSHKTIPPRAIISVMVFVVVYCLSIGVLSTLMVISGCDVTTALSAIVSCQANAGPGLGLVGPSSNYGVLTDFQLWVCTAAMLLGRLEIFTILIMFTPWFWRT